MTAGVSSTFSSAVWAGSLHSCSSRRFPMTSWSRSLSSSSSVTPIQRGGVGSIVDRLLGQLLSTNSTLPCHSPRSLPVPEQQRGRPLSAAANLARSRYKGEVKAARVARVTSGTFQPQSHTHAILLPVRECGVPPHSLCVCHSVCLSPSKRTASRCLCGQAQSWSLAGWFFASYFAHCCLLLAARTKKQESTKYVIG